MPLQSRSSGAVLVDFNQWDEAQVRAGIRKGMIRGILMGLGLGLS